MKKTTRKTGELYKLIFADGKLYIGACSKGSKIRYRGHELDARRGCPFPVYVAWRKLGPPRLIVLKLNVPLDKLWSEEKKAIIKYKTKVPYGYNSHNGSDYAPSMLGKNASEEACRNISLGVRGKKKTEEHKNNISKALTGRVFSDEHCESLRRANLGKTLTDEHKNKISLANCGDRNPFYGKKHTKKSRKKIRESHVGFIGRTHSEETIKRMAEARRLYWLKKHEESANV